MQSLRRAVRPRVPSAATVISIIALVVALSSTAYAAVVITGANVRDSSLTSVDVKDRSLLARDFRLGQLPRGAQGPAGTNGTNGTNGAQGPQGIQGVPGPFPTTLPSGKTLKGAWVLNGFGTGGASSDETAVSFAYPLAAAPTLEFVGTTTPTANCPGTRTNPQAVAGYLCLYAAVNNNGTAIGVYDPSDGLTSAPDRFGAVLYGSGTAAGTTWERSGTWAVTAP